MERIPFHPVPNWNGATRKLTSAYTPHQPAQVRVSR
jgi:hypothetical protein